jgi:nitronate monooxygenase
MMKLPELIIGNLRASVPIIQGGMGIGVSMHRLAAAVANEGGIGIISGVQIGFREKDFISNNLAANLRALKNEIKLARTLSPNGILGVNLMVAVNDYAEYVKACIQERIDLIVSGAGLPMELPGLVRGSGTMIAPIVSSAKAAALICRYWDKKFQVAPDMIVVEGPKAGGHLGFGREELANDCAPSLEKLLSEIKNAVEAFQSKYDRRIPLVVAGGIYDGADIAKFLNLGADGVQMATRFVTTVECDAAESFKQAYINTNEGDIVIVQSPVGMPGRAIRNAFIKSVESQGRDVICMYRCLKPCDPSKAPYCISTALINAVCGNTDNGLVFCGSNAYKSREVTTVGDLIKSLVREAELEYS